MWHAKRVEIQQIQFNSNTRHMSLPLRRLALACLASQSSTLSHGNKRCSTRSLSQLATDSDRAAVRDLHRQADEWRFGKLCQIWRILVKATWTTLSHIETFSLWKVEAWFRGPKLNSIAAIHCGFHCQLQESIVWCVWAGGKSELVASMAEPQRFSEYSIKVI